MNLYKTFLKKRITREWKNDTWVCYYAALKYKEGFKYERFSEFYEKQKQPHQQ